MRALRPLVRQLQRSLRTLLLRRMIAWAACAVLLVMLGGAMAQPLGKVRVVGLGLLLVACSALPAFLLWPPSEKRLTNRLRRLDEEMVFEAYLEAEPGPARDILQRLATERAAGLSFPRPVREPLLTGLRGLCAAAMASFVLVEAGSLLFLQHPFTLAPGGAPVAGGGLRIEEQGFSEFASEDPAARRMRHGWVSEHGGEARNRGENPTLGAPGASAQPIPSSRRTPSTEAEPSASLEFRASDSIAKRRQGEREGDGTPLGAGPSPALGGSPGEGSREASAPEGKPGSTRMVPSENQGFGQGGPAPNPAPNQGPRGQGYEHTADTKVPSPLLNYRSQFETRYAERTGTHISANGRMGFGELRDFQRRYFESFTLRAEVGATEDPFEASLKRRWTELKGEAW